MADIAIISVAAVLAGTNASNEYGTAGETITQGQVVYKNSTTSKIMLADNNGAVAEGQTALGIALCAAQNGQPIVYQKSGDITLSPAAIGTPTGVTATPSTTGGTLGAATQSYRISATNALGETLASAAVTAATTGTTASVALAWTAVTGATGYKIYGRTAGSEQLIATVGAVTTYTDTGTPAPSGALPTSNTTGDKLTKGATYFLSANPGAIAPDADVVAGSNVSELGIAKSATVLALAVRTPGVVR